MKMTKEHYNRIKTAIASIPRELALEHKSKELGKDKAMRFRWDMFIAAKLSTFAGDELYSYLNDDHIDTALKAVMKELDYN